jgi:hypothetical protein
MGVKLSLSHNGKKVYRGCLKIGCWRRYLALRGMKEQEANENCMMRSSVTCTSGQILLGWSNQGGWDGQGMWHVWERRAMHSLFSGAEVWRIELLGRRRCSLENIVKLDCQEVAWDNMDWIHLVQFKDKWQATWIWYWTFGFHKILGISWLAEELLASQNDSVPCSSLLSFLFVGKQVDHYLCDFKFKN